MKESSDLYDLIQSMTATEKAYFKKYAYKQERMDDSLYPVLFDLLDKQKDYDYETAHAKLKKQFPKLNWAAAKNYLHSIILRCMREYHASNLVNTQLRYQLCDIEFLLEKGLKQQAKRIIRRAEKLAERYDNYLVLLELAHYQEILTPTDKNEFENKEAIHKRRKELLEIMVNTYELGWLRRLTHLQIYSKSGGNIRTPDERQELEELMDHPLLVSPDAAHSAKGAYYYYGIKSYYYRAVDELDKSLDCRKQMVRVFEDHPDMIKTDTMLYLGGLYNLLVMLILQNRLDEFDEYWEQVQSLWESKSIRLSISNEAYLFTFWAIYLERCLYCGEVDKALQVCDEISNQLEFFRDKITERKHNDIIHSLALVYFWAGDMEESLTWLNRLMNLESVRFTNANRYMIVKLMTIIVHFELGNGVLLESLMISFYRYLTQIEKPLVFESTIVKYLKKMNKESSNKALKSLFAQLRDELVEIIRDPRERKPLEYFDFISWLESKVYNIPLAEALRNRHNRS